MRSINDVQKVLAAFTAGINDIKSINGHRQELLELNQFLGDILAVNNLDNLTDDEFLGLTSSSALNAVLGHNTPLRVMGWG